MSGISTRLVLRQKGIHWLGICGLCTCRLYRPRSESECIGRTCIAHINKTTFGDKTPGFGVGSFKVFQKYSPSRDASKVQNQHLLYIIGFVFLMLLLPPSTVQNFEKTNVGSNLPRWLMKCPISTITLVHRFHQTVDYRCCSSPA